MELNLFVEIKIPSVIPKSPKRMYQTCSGGPDALSLSQECGVSCKKLSDSISEGISLPVKSPSMLLKVFCQMYHVGDQHT